MILLQGITDQYFVQADDHIITLSDNSSVMAFDLLFKSFFVFNVEYP